MTKMNHSKPFDKKDHYRRIMGTVHMDGYGDPLKTLKRRKTQLEAHRNRILKSLKARKCCNRIKREKYQSKVDYQIVMFLFALQHFTEELLYQLGFESSNIVYTNDYGDMYHPSFYTRFNIKYKTSVNFNIHLHHGMRIPELLLYQPHITHD